jgi:aldose 1-epimerase
MSDHAFLSTRAFGLLPSGEPIHAWTLKSAAGLVVEAITYGGIVTRILAPDRDGRLADVVLGFNDLDSYIVRSPYFGAITGRVAGRIAGARFDLNGKTYELSANNPPNHLHGGAHGFDKKIWTATPRNDANGGASLSLSYRSLDGEEGYPGTVDVTVTYTVTHDNTFLIETTAVADRATPFSLTNHSYFNLAGEAAGSIADHELQIQADQFVAIDKDFTPLGRLEDVTAGVNDFRQPRRLGEAIPMLYQNHGDLYRLRKRAGGAANSTLAPAARLSHSGSGRAVEVSTTEDYLQLYTSVSLDGKLIGKSGAAYVRHAGVCLECEGYPDGANFPELGDIILRPGDRQRQTTAYAFSTVEPEDSHGANRPRSMLLNK